MRKLLLVMLVPVMVLGVMGCGDTIDPGVQTDAKIQGAWVNEAADYKVFVSAAQMSVKYMQDVVTPYRTEFSYQFADPRYISEDTEDDAADWAGEDGFDYSYTPKEGDIAALITLFRYVDNVEIATIAIVWAAGSSSADGELHVIDVTYAEDEYYYSNAMPKVGKYTSATAK
jgi:hypothetical protein